MYTGKTLFSQIMDFLPWSTFHRIVERYGGDYRVRTFRCSEHFRIMAFAQLTYRESLRDIEACLSAQSSKLYHMGIAEPVSRSTLADANESRDWRIYADFALRLITQARKLYANESLGIDLSNTVYALDSTTIDLCLSMFPWAPFRTAKAAVKVHTLLDLRGCYPKFYSHLQRQVARHQCFGFAYPGIRRFLYNGSGLCGLRSPLCTASSRQLLRNTRKVESRCTKDLFGADRPFLWHHLRSEHLPERLLQSERLSRALASHPFQGCRKGQDAGVSHKPDCASSANHLRPLQESLADRTVLQMDKTASSHQTILRHVGKCSEDSNLDSCLSVRAYRNNQKATQHRWFALHIITDIVRYPFRENALAASFSGQQLHIKYVRQSKPIEFIQFLSGH